MALTPTLSLRERGPLTFSLSRWESATLIYSLSPWERAKVSALKRLTHSPRRFLRRWQSFTRRQDQSDRPADRNFIAGLRKDLSQSTGRRRLDLDGRLVGFNFHQRLTLGNRLAFGLEPLEQNSSLLRHAEGGHDHVGCQIDSLLIELSVLNYLNVLNLLNDD